MNFVSQNTQQLADIIIYTILSGIMQNQSKNRCAVEIINKHWQVHGKFHSILKMVLDVE
jgi:hypothetical protein